MMKAPPKSWKGFSDCPTPITPNTTVGATESFCMKMLGISMNYLQKSMILGGIVVISPEMEISGNQFPMYQSGQTENAGSPV